MYDEIKSLLGIEGDGRDSLLSTIVGFTEDRLRVLLGGVEEVPPELEYIVYELSVIRFNRIGSEGMSAHSVEGESISFSDDDFLRFQSDIDAYLDSVSESKWGHMIHQQGTTGPMARPRRRCGPVSSQLSARRCACSTGNCGKTVSPSTFKVIMKGSLTGCGLGIKSIG